ncbi:MAG: hypothetical protein E7375_02865 [Clostridiales bacterium]|nr:hypothetical protein [Clostridiales bacterium]
MNTKQFNKIVIVSLCDRYTKKLAKFLSQSLDMMFCDTKDLIEYELIDKKTLKKFASKEYLKNAERSVFRHIASYTNILVNINFDYLVHNIDLLKENSLIIFVRLPKIFIKENSNVIQNIAYDERTKRLEGVCDLTVNVKKLEIDFVARKIIEEIGGIL